MLPASLPFIFAGIRVGLVRAINAMITAELFLAAVNLGALMKQSAQRFDMAGLLSIVLLLCLLGLLMQEALKALEARLLPWHLRA
jgi:ABC-type nitrate/sulfonate/bicarbonate transport system permease component